MEKLRQTTFAELSDTLRAEFDVKSDDRQVARVYEVLAEMLNTHGAVKVLEHLKKLNK